MNNLACVKAIYEAFGKGDIAFILGCLDENIAWEKWNENYAQKADIPYLREKDSIEGVKDFFIETGKLGVKNFEVISIMEGGDKIAVEFEIETALFHEEEMHLWSFNDSGKVIAFRHYLDTAKHITANEKLKSASA